MSYATLVLLLAIVLAAGGRLNAIESLFGPVTMFFVGRIGMKPAFLGSRQLVIIQAAFWADQQFDFGRRGLSDIGVTSAGVPPAEVPNRDE